MASEHFVKIYGTILDSSIWSEDLATRILWFAMLVMADSTGFVEASRPGLARRANLSAPQCKAALKILEGPDIESKSQEYAGRRIEKVDRGWQILNYMQYREMRTEAQVRRAERQARWREKKRLQKHPVDAVDGQRGEGRGEKGVYTPPISPPDAHASPSREPHGPVSAPAALRKYLDPPS